jgi:hypothetical protein
MINPKIKTNKKILIKCTAMYKKKKPADRLGSMIFFHKK